MRALACFANDNQGLNAKSLSRFSLRLLSASWRSSEMECRGKGDKIENTKFTQRLCILY